MNPLLSLINHYNPLLPSSILVPFAFTQVMGAKIGRNLCSSLRGQERSIRRIRGSRGDPWPSVWQGIITSPRDGLHLAKCTTSISTGF